MQALKSTTLQKLTYETTLNRQQGTSDLHSRTTYTHIQTQTRIQIQTQIQIQSSNFREKSIFRNLVFFVNFNCTSIFTLEQFHSNDVMFLSTITFFEFLSTTLFRMFTFFHIILNVKCYFLWIKILLLDGFKISFGKSSRVASNEMLLKCS